MNWILFGLVALWLAVVSWFDLRRHEVPHSTWVVLPLIVAAAYRMFLGGWELVLLTAVVAVASERERIAALMRLTICKPLINWALLLALAFLPAARLDPLTAVAILAFWLAWEWRVWGGADAVSAITLFLLWPGAALLMALFLAHLAVVLIAGLTSFIKEKAFRVHRLPGLPILFTSTLLMAAIALLVQSA